MDKVIEKWDEILNTVKTEHEISDVSFDTWMRPLEVFAVDECTFTDFGNIFTDFNADEVFAFIKSLFFNNSNSIGKLNADDVTS